MSSSRNPIIRDIEAPRASQYDRVLRVLLDEGEACGNAVFYGRMRIPRFSVHLHRMRQRGFVISRRPCDDDDHQHEGVSYIYALEAVPPKEEGKPCEACGGILGHVWNCLGRQADQGRLPGIGVGGAL